MANKIVNIIESVLFSGIIENLFFAVSFCILVGFPLYVISTIP